MAALLTSVRDDKDKSALYLHECRRMGVKVLPPDVNSSNADFSPVGTDIRYGLAGIRNVGTNVVASICAVRRSKGAYTGFADFLAKVEPVVCNKKVIESLIKAGAFDSLGHTRQGLLRIHAEAVDACMDTKRAEAVGQFDLFSSTDDPGGGAEEDTSSIGGMDLAIPLTEWDKSILLAYEREMLGLYVSDHPLLGIEHVIASAVDCPVSALSSDDRGDGTVVTVGGILSTVARKMTKRGDSWATATLEDLEGAIEVLFFPATYAQVGLQVVEDALVVLKGRPQARDDSVELIVSDLTLPDLNDRAQGPVVVSVAPTICSPALVERLREVLAAHPGATEVHLQLVNGERSQKLRLGDGYRVAPTAALKADLKALLGSRALSA
jgi:DNA polymerase-3 subunit alpha